MCAIEIEKRLCAGHHLVSDPGHQFQHEAQVSHGQICSTSGQHCSSQSVISTMEGVSALQRTNMW